VAELTARRNENHSSRTDPRQHLRIVAGAAGHSQRRAALLPGHALNPVDQHGIERYRLQAHQRSARHIHVLAGGDWRDRCFELRFRACEGALYRIA
jgi:hypothetical protein